MQAIFDIDFRELADFDSQPKGTIKGYRFQCLVREIGLALGYGVQPGGTGTDGGKDHIFAIMDHRLYDKQISRQWLVSCKDFSKSGDSVGRDDLTNALNDTLANRCTGFLLASTTNVSDPARTLLRELESNGHISTHVWDGTTIKRLLHENEELFVLTLVRYFPKTYSSTVPLVSRLLENFLELLEQNDDATFPDLENLIGRVQDLSSSTTNQVIKFRLGESLLFRLSAAKENDLTLLYPILSEWIPPDGQTYAPFVYAMEYYLREVHLHDIGLQIQQHLTPRARDNKIVFQKLVLVDSTFVITIEVNPSEQGGNIPQQVKLCVAENSYDILPL